MKRLLPQLFFIATLLLILGCEKSDPVKPNPIQPDPVKPEPIPPTIIFSGITQSGTTLDYGQGIDFKVYTNSSSTLSIQGQQENNTNELEFKLRELTRDTSFTFIAHNKKDNLSSIQTLNIKINPPDPFFLKVLGVWKFAKIEIFDYPNGDVNKELEWRDMTGVGACGKSQKIYFTIRNEYILTRNPGCAIDGVLIGSPWFTFYDTDKGEGWKYFKHNGSFSNEANDHYEYFYFKGDTLVWYQEFVGDTKVEMVRSGRISYVKFSDDYYDGLDPELLKKFRQGYGTLSFVPNQERSFR